MRTGITSGMLTVMNIINMQEISLLGKKTSLMNIPKAEM